MCLFCSKVTVVGAVPFVYYSLLLFVCAATGVYLVNSTKNDNITLSHLLDNFIS